MRTIKFRAWDSRYNCMYNWNELALEEKQVFISDGDLYRRYDDELYLMQFTGLLDKNGKEIYEGDVVQCTEEKNGSETGKRKIVFAKHEWKTARLENDEDFYKHCLGLNWGGWESFEVIGNIYQNEELLK